MKFGGTSVADAERIKRAAQRIVDKREAGFSVVAVLSARGSTTDELIAMAQALSADPDPREMDMLLSAGERISPRALRDRHQRSRSHRAISLTGLPGRNHDGRLPHQDADHRRPHRDHASAPRSRRTRSCSSRASRASRRRRTSPRSVAAARTRRPSRSPRRSARRVRDLHRRRRRLHRRPADRPGRTQSWPPSHLRRCSEMACPPVRASCNCAPVQYARNHSVRIPLALLSQRQARYGYCSPTQERWSNH